MIEQSVFDSPVAMCSYILALLYLVLHLVSYMCGIYVCLFLVLCQIVLIFSSLQLKLIHIKVSQIGQIFFAIHILSVNENATASVLFLDKIHVNVDHCSIYSLLSD